ncbi:MAG: Ig-like domain-containing protein, partial [Oscillospiraceae bacterium]|nr:Ig-like domain-containing protein [Oscillospiraceae bacterium]
MKKFLSLLLAVLMVIGCMPGALADVAFTEYTSFNLWYTQNTHVKKGEVIALTVQDGEGNALTSENASLTFESSNPAVATVDENGNVTGVNPGVAVISAKLSNNKTELDEQKIMIAVENGNVNLQSFETIDDAAWPKTKPRTGERSYIVSNDGILSTFSYRSSVGVEEKDSKNYWGSASRQVISIWFYDDGKTITNAGPTVILGDNSGTKMFTFRTNNTEYFARKETDVFAPEIIETSIDIKTGRSIGWHQVLFDFTKANKGDGTGERKAYLDGAIIYSEIYKCATDARAYPGQIAVQSNRANVSGQMFFDDMNSYCVTRDYTAKPVVTDVKIEKSKNFLSSTYDFHDANDADDLSAYQWQISESKEGEFFDIPGENYEQYVAKSSDAEKYVRVKIIPGNGVTEGKAAYSEAIKITEADISGATRYSSFNLWYTPKTNVKKGASVPLTVKDGKGNVLNSENASLSFKSLNPAVATVDENGNVTGVNPGVAVISAKLLNNAIELAEQKIMITVFTDKENTHSFEAVDDAAWPKTKPRLGERSYEVKNDGSLSGYSYKNSEGTNLDANKFRWNSKGRHVYEMWFYDDNVAFNNANGPTIFLWNSSSLALFSVRMHKNGYYYAQTQNDGFAVEVTATAGSNNIARSAGWHQVVFDFTKGDKGNGTGERKVYIDGELLLKQEYKFDGTYTAPEQIVIQPNRTAVAGTMYFDDMSAYSVIKDLGAKPVAEDITVKKIGNFIYGNYKFYDANDALDASSLQWQISDDEIGEFADISGAVGKRYEITEEDSGKYMRLKVTPENNLQIAGENTFSNVIGPIEVQGKEEVPENTASLIECATVKMSKSNTYGRSVKIEVRNFNKPYMGFLKFDLSGIDREKMESAILRMYLVEQGGEAVDANITASLVNGDWSEATLNRTNVPDISQTEKVTFTIKNHYRWYEADISSILENVEGNTVSLCITGDNASATVAFCGADSLYPAEIVFGEEEYLPKESYDMINVPDSMVDYELVKAGRYYHSEKYDFKTRLVKNISGYNEINSLPETDIYGGYTDKKFAATGKFYLETDENERWWLVDPLGNGFISKGVNAVTVNNKTTEETEAYKAKYTSSTPAAQWAQETKALLVENGFNTLGGWSSRNLFFTNTQAYMPYVTTWSIMGDYINSIEKPFSTYVPVFDAEF